MLEVVVVIGGAFNRVYFDGASGRDSDLIKSGDLG